MEGSDDSQSGRSVDRRAFLALLGSSGITALSGCSGGGSTTPTETEPEDRGGSQSPTDADERTASSRSTAGVTTTATATSPDTASPTETAASTDTRTSTPDPSATPTGPEGGPLSPLPEPPGDDVPRPSGEAGNLRVLDWAGFDGAVSYTFDDSQPSQLAHYEELNRTGVGVTFYLTSNVDYQGYEEGWKRVAPDGHEIGNHTVSHPYADLSDPAFGPALDSASAEIAQCSEYVTGTIGQRDVWTMAAPFGDDGWNEYAREADLFLNRGVGGGTIAPGDGTDPFDLPCYMAREGDTAETFNPRIDRAHSNGEWLIFLFHSIAPTDQNWYAPVDVGEITASVDHAKSLDSLWIDTVANVGAYWRGQRIFESGDTTESGGEKTWSWSLPEAFPPGQHLRVTVDGGTVEQDGEELAWNSRGYYEVSLDAGSLTLVS